MKFVLASFGTRGDVAPMALLGRALQEAGEDVILLGPDDEEGRYRAFVERYGVRYEGQLWADYKKVLSQITEAGLKSNEEFGRNSVVWLIDNIPRETELLMEHVDNDTILITNGYCFSGESVCRVRTSQHFSLSVNSNSHRSKYWFPLGDRRSVGTLKEIEVAWDREQIGTNFLFRKPMEEVARRVGLSLPLTATESSPGHRVIHAVEPSLLPVAAQNLFPQPLGSLLDNDERALSNEAIEFIAKSDKPIVTVGIGSLAEPNPDFVLGVVVACARKLDVRVIIQKGWAGFDGISGPDIFYIGECSHQVLFQHSQLVVHHGGSGTTHRTARSGTPQLIVPYFLDQFFWGARVHANGLGPVPVARGQLTEGGFLGSLRDGLFDSQYRENAKKFSATMLTDAEQRITDLLRAGDFSKFAAGRHGEILDE